MKFRIRVDRWIENVFEIKEKRKEKENVEQFHYFYTKNIYFCDIYSNF